MSREKGQYNFSYFIKAKQEILEVHFNHLSRHLCRERQITQFNEFKNIGLNLRYQLEVHENFILFRQNKSNRESSPKISQDFQQDEKNQKGIPKYQQQQHTQLRSVLKNFFTSIRIWLISPTKLHQKNKFANLCKCLNKELQKNFICYKLIWQKQEHFNIGDLILYYHNQMEQSAISIKRKIFNFHEEELLFPLDQYFAKSLISSDQFKKDIARQFIKKFYEQIKEITQQCKLILIDIRVETDRHPGYLSKCSLKFIIQGQNKKFINYFFKIEDLLEKNPVKIVTFDEIKCCKLNQIQQYLNQYKVGTLNYKTIVIFDCKQSQLDIQKKIRTGPWLINMQFKSQQLKLLNKQQRQLKGYLHQNNVFYQNLSIQSSRILITSTRQTKDKFLILSKKFLQSKKLIQFQCKQFDTQLLIDILLKYYRNDLQNQQNISFTKIAKNKLERKNYQSRNQIIIDKLKQIKKDILNKLVRVPSLKKIISKQDRIYSLENNPIECKQINLKDIRYRFQGHIQIGLCYIQSISTLHKNLILVVGDDLSQQKQFIKIMAENEMNAQNLIQNLKMKSQQRLSQIITSKSRYCENITVLYINERQFRRKRIRKDVQLLIDQIKKNPKAYFILPDIINSDNLKIFLLNLIGVLDQLDIHHQNQDLLRQVILYCQNQKVLQFTQRYLQKEKLIFKQFLHLDEVRIDKIKNMKYYQLSYYQRQLTKKVSPINSFIFHHQRTKIKQSRAPILIPKATVNNCQYQYLIDYKKERYYQTHNKIILSPKILNNLKPRLKLISQIIKKYFKKIQYLVIICNQANKILEQINFYYADSENILKPIKINIQSQTITTITQISQQIQYAQQQNNYLQWFIYQTYKDQEKQLRQTLMGQ